MWFPSKLNLELHLGSHTCWLSYFTLVCLWCSIARCTVTWLPNFLGWVDYHISLAMGLRAQYRNPWSGYCIWYPYPRPGWGFTFSSCPWRLNKITFTPEDVEQIWVFPLMWVYLRKNLSQPRKNFVILNASPPTPPHPQKKCLFFSLHSKRNPRFLSL